MGESSSRPKFSYFSLLLSCYFSPGFFVQKRSYLHFDLTASISNSCLRVYLRPYNIYYVFYGKIIGLVQFTILRLRYKPILILYKLLFCFRWLCRMKIYNQESLKSSNVFTNDLNYYKFYQRLELLLVKFCILNLFILFRFIMYNIY